MPARQTRHRVARRACWYLVRSQLSAKSLIPRVLNLPRRRTIAQESTRYWSRDSRKTLSRVPGAVPCRRHGHFFIKPAVREKTGYELIDLRNVARAGVIDNVKRGQIRGASFVLVDLTHDNSGAYWEAGYGEDLGKPVIYMCEQNKFDNDKTHFDTNHGTTVTWSINDPEPFVVRLIATLRRSLSLFPSEAAS